MFCIVFDLAMVVISSRLARVCLKILSVRCAFCFVGNLENANIN